MAVAQAQHILKEMSNLLKRKYKVSFAIHPVGKQHHENLLAEANVPYDDVI